MNRKTHQGGASALPLATAFVAMGGRIMLSPAGQLEAAIDPAIIFGADIMPEAAREAHRAATALLGVMANPRAVSSLKCLVLRQGERTPGGWLIVGGDA